jgi:hypothetical protein
MERLRRRLGYWNLFRDQRGPEEIGFAIGHNSVSIHDPMSYRFGVSTDQNTKPKMIGNLQSMILAEQIGIPCKDTIAEMVGFTQERTKLGIVNRFRGAGGTKDDRVMSLAIAAYIAVSYPIEQFFQGVEAPVAPISAKDSEEWQRIHSDLERSMSPKRGYF